jgi:hypothetical protein
MFKQIRPGPKAQNNAAAFGLHAQRLRRRTQQSLKTTSVFHIDRNCHKLRHGDTANDRLGSCAFKESIKDALSRKRPSAGLGLTSQTASMSFGCRTGDHQAAA